ncbi:acid ceramidase-like isoform X1 [Penaeus indicus]|uniref:acid ceramidase-like isoform X1 n=2 Tax=Penaeus indicus TaxID=29960 RepID=UPI00300DA2E0
MKIIFLLCFSTISFVNARSSNILPFHACETNAFPPSQSDAVPRFTIDLDLPPRERWAELMAKKGHQVVGLIDDVKTLMLSLLGDKIFYFIYDNLPKVATSLPHPYDEEIIGISKVTGLPLPETTLYNIFYEVFSFCTSIITEDETGRLYHGRNLDFGLLMGWDTKNHTWRVSELLKPLVVHLEWKKGGKTVYESINYAGYIGILTAVKKEKFTFSLDERFVLNGGYMGFLEWILFKDYSQKWVSFLTREVMEEAQSYEEAKKMFSHSRLIAPAYFILGGSKPREGTIITRWRDNFHTDDLFSKKSGSGTWYLVETNYDQWKSPPFYDDRRTPAVTCLDKSGQKNASLALIYNVLSTKPVFNKLTTYTSLMDVQEGYIGAWLRYCEDPCWPW